MAPARCWTKSGPIGKVRAFLHRCPSGSGGSITVLHLAVLLEEGDVVDRGLDAQDDTELVVHFERHPVHLMLDACAQQPNVEAIAHLSLIVAMQLAPQKSSDIGGFDRLDQGLQEMRVDSL